MKEVSNIFGKIWDFGDYEQNLLKSKICKKIDIENSIFNTVTSVLSSQPLAEKNQVTSGIANFFGKFIPLQENGRADSFEIFKEFALRHRGNFLKFSK